MLEEAKKQFFLRWTNQLVESGLRNLRMQVFEWKGRKLPSTFVLLKGLQEKLCLSEDILICGLCFVKKVVVDKVRVDENSIYKLAVVSIFIAQKFYSDFHYDVEEFSISCGITMKDLVKLQEITVKLLNYSLVLSEQDYNSVMQF